LNRLDFFQSQLKYIGNNLKNKSPNLVIETIALVNLVTKEVISRIKSSITLVLKDNFLTKLIDLNVLLSMDQFRPCLDKHLNKTFIV